MSVASLNYLIHGAGFSYRRRTPNSSHMVSHEHLTTYGIRKKLPTALAEVGTMWPAKHIKPAAPYFAIPVLSEHSSNAARPSCAPQSVSLGFWDWFGSLLTLRSS